MAHGHVSIVVSGQVSGMQHQMKRYLMSGIDRFIQSLAQQVSTLETN